VDCRRAADSDVPFDQKRREAKSTGADSSVAVGNEQCVGKHAGTFRERELSLAADPALVRLKRSISSDLSRGKVSREVINTFLESRGRTALSLIVRGRRAKTSIY
jgi:hypothetical protein